MCWAFEIRTLPTKLLCSQIVNLVLLFAERQPGLEQLLSSVARVSCTNGGQ